MHTIAISGKKKTFTRSKSLVAMNNKMVAMQALLT
jgi:hypothetical protein